MLSLLFLPVLAFLTSHTIAFPAPSLEDKFQIARQGLVFCLNKNVTIDLNGTSLDEPRAYTFSLALIPGFGDPLILATAIDLWKRQLSAKPADEPIPDDGRRLTYPQTVYEVRIAQAGDRRLEYYHAQVALEQLRVHFWAIRQEVYVALAEVRIWAGDVLEGRVTIIARRHLKGISCDGDDEGIGMGDARSIKEAATS